MVAVPAVEPDCTELPPARDRRRVLERPDTDVRVLPRDRGLLSVDATVSVGDVEMLSKSETVERGMIASRQDVDRRYRSSERQQF